MPVYPPTYANPDERRRLQELYLPKAEAAARKAISLDARNADAFAALGASLDEGHNLIPGRDALGQALKLDPNNLIALSSYAHHLSVVGHLKESLATWQKLNELDPLDRRPKINVARMLALNGKYDAAVAIYQKLGTAYVDLATVYAAQGRFQEAADQLLRVPIGTYPAGTVESASRILRSAPSQVSSPPNLPTNLQFVFLYVGAASRAVHFGSAVGDPVWFPAAAPVRKSERFKTSARDAGLLDYWRARGWPDLCHPVGADDFACN
jgi:Flp pilus assembly protein TadD